MSSGKIYDIWHRRHDYWLLAGIVTYPWPSQAGQDPGVFLCGPRGGMWACGMRSQQPVLLTRCQDPFLLMMMVMMVTIVEARPFTLSTHSNFTAAFQEGHHSSSIIQRKKHAQRGQVTCPGHTAKMSQPIHLTPQPMLPTPT